MHHYPTREDNLLVCDSYIDASYMIVFSYPIFLIVICTVYAVLTRKIPEAFNESKHIGKLINFTFYPICSANIRRALLICLVGRAFVLRFGCICVRECGYVMCIGNVIEIHSLTSHTHSIHNAHAVTSWHLAVNFPRSNHLYRHNDLLINIYVLVATHQVSQCIPRVSYGWHSCRSTSVPLIMCHFVLLQCRWRLVCPRVWRLRVYFRQRYVSRHLKTWSSFISI